jgi:hypothetical protein
MFTGTYALEQKRQWHQEDHGITLYALAGADNGDNESKYSCQTPATIRAIVVSHTICNEQI